MFGYATDETEEKMPLSLVLAHKLMAHHHALRKSGVLDWALPDSKSQVALSTFILPLSQTLSFSFLPYISYLNYFIHI